MRDTHRFSLCVQTNTHLKIFWVKQICLSFSCCIQILTYLLNGSLLLDIWCTIWQVCNSVVVSPIWVKLFMCVHLWVHIWLFVHFPCVPALRESVACHSSHLVAIQSPSPGTWCQRGTEFALLTSGSDLCDTFHYHHPLEHNSTLTPDTPVKDSQAEAWLPFVQCLGSG